MLLVCIVCIDERYDELKQCLKQLERDPLPKRYLGVFRESDVECQQLMSNHLTVPDYQIDGRHNFNSLATKRTLGLRYAMQHGYKQLVFIDSDILIFPNITLKLLMIGANHSDICLVPYPIRWFKNVPALGYLNPDGNVTIESSMCLRWYGMHYDKS